MTNTRPLVESKAAASGSLPGIQLRYDLTGRGVEERRGIGVAVVTERPSTRQRNHRMDMLASDQLSGHVSAVEVNGRDTEAAGDV